DDSVGIHQVVGLRIIKLRISPQKLRERVEVSLESRGLDDLVHLAADSFYLGKPNFVYLFGGQVRSSLPAKMKRVGCRSIRQSTRCNVLAAGRNIRSNEIVVQLLERRHNA